VLNISATAFICAPAFVAYLRLVWNGIRLQVYPHQSKHPFGLLGNIYDLLACGYKTIMSLASAISFNPEFYTKSS